MPLCSDGDVTIPAGEVAGILSLPDNPMGIVLFANGSGSCRFSPRNRCVASALHERGLGTLIVDLLTTEEERADASDAHLRFDIRLLARRLAQVTDWARRDPRMRELPVAYFGASTGAAAALIAAAERPEAVAAVVSRGGRPDLAGDFLPEVVAPTLLIVGGADVTVLELNRDAAARMRAPCTVSVVPGATHLFGEPGALDEVSRRAGDFLVAQLGAVKRQEVTVARGEGSAALRALRE